METDDDVGVAIKATNHLIVKQFSGHYAYAQLRIREGIFPANEPSVGPAGASYSQLEMLRFNSANNARRLLFSSQLGWSNQFAGYCVSNKFARLL